MVDDARLIDPGRVVATPAALAALEAVDDNAATYVGRHVRGDWGTTGTWDATEVTERERLYGAMATDDGAKLNRLSVEMDNGSRIISTYTLADGEELMVITEGTGADRVTTVLLPRDY